MDLNKGDIIKLQSKKYSFNRFGDILIIDEVEGDMVGVEACHHPQCEELRNYDFNSMWYYSSNEYIVIHRLENNFKKGQIVRFKAWDNMAAQYIVNESGDIVIYFGSQSINFVKEMAHLCGTYATIEKIDHDGFVYLSNFTAKGDTAWPYCLDMLEVVE